MSVRLHSLKCVLVCFALTCALELLLAAAGSAQDNNAEPLILVTPVEGAIGPPTTDHLASVIATAEERDAALIVLRMDTPGGLVQSTRDINDLILSARVPVAVHVAPPGARAASAGTYILYASHVAAMAPGTNLGAATPVAVGGSQDGAEDGTGGDDGDTLERKRINDAVASIRSLAELRGRNADWAEKAVREAASLTASQAEELGVIEHLVADTSALAAAADGRTVKIDGAEQSLVLDEPRIETVEPSLVNRLLSILANPNVSLLLMTLGFYGLLYELASPGLGPGIVGAILMLLGLYSLNTLPVNYTGIALILLGLLLLGTEALSPSFGIVGAGGIAAFGIGAAILIDTESAAFQVSPGIIATLCAVSAGVVALMVGAVIGTRRQAERASSGVMEGARATVLDWQGTAGHVRVHGERWQATGPSDLKPGEPARVDHAEGLKLHLNRDDGDQN